MFNKHFKPRFANMDGICCKIQRTYVKKLYNLGKCVHWNANTVCEIKSHSILFSTKVEEAIVILVRDQARLLCCASDGSTSLSWWEMSVFTFFLFHSMACRFSVQDCISLEDAGKWFALLDFWFYWRLHIISWFFL